MAVNVKNNVYWVGKTDWELRKFHGQEYSTHRGTTYNSYLIKEKKTALIETVWKPFAEEFVAGLAKEIDLKSIDFIIANHAEVDHSGGLPLLMEQIPDTPIYCTKNGVKSIKGHYHKDWNFKTVGTGDTLSLGDKDLVFIEARMLHWPDTMMCYLTGDNILFSNDAFGQHYASEYLFNDLVDQGELFAECIKYYANILTPFSPLVKKKIEEILSLQLPLDIICTSHGVVWRDNPVQIVEKYLAWADAYQEDQVTIVYDTMWDGTRMMAEAIAQGIKQENEKINIKLFNSGRADKNDIIAEIFKSRAVLVGSPTINRGVLTSTAAIIEMMKGLKFKNKSAAAFGCYGWSGESIKVISEGLKEAGFGVESDGLKVLWNPDEGAMEECIQFGSDFIKSIDAVRQ